MIFPLTHENMEARRWPVLTTFEAGVADIPSAKAGIAYVKLLLANNRHVEAGRALDVLDASNMVPELRADVASLRAQTRGAFMEVGP